MALEISAIVPTYNRATLIATTLRSLLTQSCKPAEVIVVDDGSSDDTEAVVRTFGAAVKYIRIDNSGPCRARNVGVRASCSQYIAFCDSDDIWLSDKLEQQFKIFEAAPNVDFVFSDFRTFTDERDATESKFESLSDEFWRGLPVKRLNSELSIIESPLVERLLRRQPIFPSTIAMKRSFFDAIGGWVECLGRTPSEDLEFVLRAAAHYPIGVVSKPVVGIRKHSSNFSGDNVRTTLGEIQILQYVLDHHAPGKRLRSLILDQVRRRREDVAAASFSAGDFETMRKVLAPAPMWQRSSKLHVKAAIARLPRALRSSVLKRMVSEPTCARLRS
jgi:glycosyltransferase involved in cell wall biosynthesis